MIWDILQQSTFNNYFSSPLIQSLTPQILLLDENIITQFKNLNPLLISYVQQHYDQFISKLISYTIQLPNQNDSQNRIRKLPYVSSEVLAIDNQILYKAFFKQNNQSKQNNIDNNNENNKQSNLNIQKSQNYNLNIQKNSNNINKKDYFKQLMNIFVTQSKYNEILMGYFIKIINNLYKCQKLKTAHKIYQFRQIFYQNLNQQSVAIIFKLFLVLLETKQGYLLAQRQQVINRLIDQLVDSNDEQVRRICSRILIQVINKFQTFSSGDELLKVILESKVLDRIYKIKNSEGVDEFVMGYMSKGLERICTSGQQKKSLLQVSQLHKQLIKQYIINKLQLLSVNNSGDNNKQVNLGKQIIQNKQCIQQQRKFMNQNRVKVCRLDKRVQYLIVIIRLGLQNNITNILNQSNILSLFNILNQHPYNDIIKVKIFNIFNLLFTKKDQLTQSLFLKHYYHQTIILYQQFKSMYSYHLYLLYKTILKYKKLYSFNHINNNYNINNINNINNNNKIDNNINNNNSQALSLLLNKQQLSIWSEIIKYFELNQIYQKQTQKIVDKYSNTTKVVKLTVDQQDNTPTLTFIQNNNHNNNNNNINYSKQSPISTKQPTQTSSKLQQKPISITSIQITPRQKPKQNKKSNNDFSFDFFLSPNPIQPKIQTKTQTKTKIDPFASFEFFSNSKSADKKQIKKQQNKKNDFSDFTNFC